MITGTCRMVDGELNLLPNDYLPPLTSTELMLIRQQVNKRHKGMASRATYQDMNEAIGISLRALHISDADKREFAIRAARHLHYQREATRIMSVDHICNVAGVSIKRTEATTYKNMDCFF